MSAKNTPRNQLLYVLGETGYVRYKDTKRLFNTHHNLERVVKDLRTSGLVVTDGEPKKRVIKLTLAGREYVGNLFPNFIAGVKEHRKTDDSYVVRQCVVAKAMITMLQMGIPIRRSGFADTLGTCYVPGKIHFKEMMKEAGTEQEDVDRIARGGRRAGTLITEWEFFNVHQFEDARVKWEDAFEKRQVSLVEMQTGRGSGMLILADTDDLIKEVIEYQKGLTADKKSVFQKRGILKSHLPDYYSSIYYVNTEQRTYTAYPDEGPEYEETGYAYAETELKLICNKKVREYVNAECMAGYEDPEYTTVNLLPMDMRKIYSMYADRDKTRKYQIVCLYPYMDVLRELFPDEARYKIIDLEREAVERVMSGYEED